MKDIAAGIQVSRELYDIVEDHVGEDVVATFESLAKLVREFRQENQELLDKRSKVQAEFDDIITQASGTMTPQTTVAKLQEIGYIKEESEGKIEAGNFDEEVSPMAGPQLVVPADKANMVLNALNARWGSLYKALYSSNVVQSAPGEGVRRAEVRRYTNAFLDKVATFEHGVVFDDIERFSFDDKKKELIAHTQEGETARLDVKSKTELVGVNLYTAVSVDEFFLNHNGLMVQVKLDEHGRVEDVLLESVLTFIIDLEDASHSGPASKYAGYRNILGIMQGDLTCEVRGEVRAKLLDTTYFEPQLAKEHILKRTALPLVRDVGAHMLADSDIITIDEQPVPERMLDCFITSLFGMRYHVAPKMHGAEEVAFAVKMWDRINELQGLEKNANKMGIMNEETRTAAQLKDCLLAAKDIAFFVNSGFMDYTGSFIDLMMHKGAIASYRDLPRMLYKTAYEKDNVYEGLKLDIAQVGAGMWPKIKDMDGLLNSKVEQTRALNDTGWSPSPPAGVIHAMAFHLAGDVRQMQKEFKVKPLSVHKEDLFTFPYANLGDLSADDVQSNLDFAVHGLLAYAEPWVRRGVGCSGVKDLSGEPLMEDRATARIKTAFVRNWLLHNVISAKQVEKTIKAMAKLVDKQNADVPGYQPISKRKDNVVQAVHDLIFNPEGHRDSYVEPALYAAYKREQEQGAKTGKEDDVGDW